MEKHSPLFAAQALEVYPTSGTPLRGLTIEASSKDWVVLLGPNGAGKETFCRCAARLLPISAGSLTFKGKPLEGGAARGVRAGIVVILKGRRVFPELTVDENLRFVRRDYVEALAPFASAFQGMLTRYSQMAGTLSGGEQQLLAIARAMLFDPAVLIVDEPSLGLSPAAIGHVYAAIKLYRERGGCVVTTEERLTYVSAYASRYYLLVRGRTVAGGSASEVTRHPEAREAYIADVLSATAEVVTP